MLSSKACCWIFGTAASALLLRGAPGPTSPELSAMIAAGLPKYAPPAPRPAAPPPAAGDSPWGKPILLPQVVVRTRKLPSAGEVTGTAWEPLLEKNLGSRDGLDRGVLNRYTLGELWQKIPLLNLLNFIGTSGSMSNEQRALALEPR
jgi:hypothetical protein